MGIFSADEIIDREGSIVQHRADQCYARIDLVASAGAFDMARGSFLADAQDLTDLPVTLAARGPTNAVALTLCDCRAADADRVGGDQLARRVEGEA